MKVFIVPGYHMPRDFFIDEAYNKYFNFVCREIKKISAADKVIIVLSGGNIDMDEPYNRILSKEMKGPFSVIADGYNLNYSIFTEEKSLSSIENLIYSKDIINSIDGEKEIYIFSDLQRADRTKLTSDIIVFGAPILLGLLIYKIRGSLDLADVMTLIMVFLIMFFWQRYLFNKER